MGKCVIATRTRSGRLLSEVTVAALSEGAVGPFDLAIYAETLLRQAHLAEAKGYAALALGCIRLPRCGKQSAGLQPTVALAGFWEAA